MVLHTQSLLHTKHSEQTLAFMSVLPAPPLSVPDLPPALAERAARELNESAESRAAGACVVDGQRPRDAVRTGQGRASEPPAAARGVFSRKIIITRVFFSGVTHKHSLHDAWSHAVRCRPCQPTPAL